MINRAHIQWQNYERARGKWKIRSLPFSESKFFLSEQLWFNVFAFLFGMASINGLYPFGLSYLAAAVLHRKKFITTAIFSFLGILLAMKSPAALRYLGAMSLFTLGVSFFKTRVKHRELLVGLLVFISNALAGLLYLSIMGMSPYDLLLLGMESGLACIVTFIIPGGLSWFFKVPVQEAEKSVCLAILAGVGLSIVGNFKIYGINIKNIISVLGVLIMALTGGPGAGATTGIIIGITGSSFAISPWLVAILAFSGLVAGTFNKMGKPGVILGFVLGYVLYNLYVNSMGESLIPWTALAVSCGILLMLPAGFLKKLDIYLNETAAQSLKNQADIIKSAGDRLYEMAALLEELGKAFVEPLGRNNDICQGEFLNRVCQEAQQKVCSSCGLNRTCWERELARTVRSFYGLIKACEADRSVGLPHLFRVRCGKTGDIKKIIDEFSCVYNLERHMNNIAKYSREKIRACFQEAAGIVKNLVKDMPQDYTDAPIEAKLAEKFSSLGVRIERIHFQKDNCKHEISMVKSPCIGERQCEALIPRGLSEVMGKRFSIRVLDCPLKSGSSWCRLKAVSEEGLGVAVGVAGAAKEGFEVSGDDFCFSELSDGRYLLALSDGMGVGDKAAKHSERTLTLLERLMEAGFDYDAALKITNSAMAASYGDESFSTVDMAVIDTYTGMTDFIKAGSAAGFVKRGFRVETIKGGSLPVGIMDEVCPRVIHRDLKSGDIVVMVTDGVIDALSGHQDGEEQLKKLLSGLRTANPQEIVDEVLKKARLGSAARDDMTVMAARLWDK